MKNKIKVLEENLNKNLALNSLDGKLDIKPIKEEMRKWISLYSEMANIENKLWRKIIVHNNRLIHVKLSSNHHKYEILSKIPSQKGLGIYT